MPIQLFPLPTNPKLKQRTDEREGSRHKSILNYLPARKRKWERERERGGVVNRKERQARDFYGGSGGREKSTN